MVFAETDEPSMDSSTGAELILSSEIFRIVNRCLLITRFTLRFLRFVFSLTLTGSDSTLTTVPLQTNSRSSIYGLPFSVKSLLPMIEARSQAQDVAYSGIWHQERESDTVAWSDEVPFGVEVNRDVVRALRSKEWEESLEGGMLLRGRRYCWVLRLRSIWVSGGCEMRAAEEDIGDPEVVVPEARQVV